MNYDKPNSLPPAIIRPFYKVAQEDCANNDYTNRSKSDSPDLGGYPFFASTNLSNASGTTLQQHQIIFIPREGPIPSVEQARVHLSHLMEIKPEITNKG